MLDSSILSKFARQVSGTTSLVLRAVAMDCRGNGRGSEARQGDAVEICCSCRRRLPYQPTNEWTCDRCRGKRHRAHLHKMLAVGSSQCEALLLISPINTIGQDSRT